MNMKTQRVLIVSAIIVIILAIAGIVFAVLYSNGVFDHNNDNEIPIATHEDTEYYTNDDGTPNKTVYYKDNVYAGSIDYVYKNYDSYVIHYDENDKEVKSEKYTVNALGNPTYASIKENGELVSLTEYTYYDDMATLWKKVVKTYEGGTETAVREIYSESGALTDKYTYTNGTEVGHETYKANEEEPATGAN